MSKRLTDTEIWEKEWFMNLSPRDKCLVKFVFDKCDLCGIWSANFKAASIYIGEQVTIDDLLSIDCGKQFKKIGNKIFVPDFIKFQYGKLSMTSRVHKSVCNHLIKNNLSHLVDEYLADESDVFIAKRKRITSVKRNEIFSSDGYRCQYCGCHPEKYDLNIDHIIPIAKGGDNEDDNLTSICVSCNSKKKDLDAIEFIKKYNMMPLDRLSKKLDTLYKKLDTPKEKVKDKEYILVSNLLTEIEENEKFVMVVIRMMTVWMEGRPDYAGMKEVDYPALLNVAYLMAKSKGWMKADIVDRHELDVVDSWEKICKFLNGDADKFLKGLTLDGIAIPKNFQKIVEAMKTSKTAIVEKQRQQEKNRINPEDYFKE